MLELSMAFAGAIVGYLLKGRFQNNKLEQLETENAQLRSESTYMGDKLTIIQQDKEIKLLQDEISMLKKANEDMYDLGRESKNSFVVVTPRGKVKEL